MESKRVMMLMTMMVVMAMGSLLVETKAQSPPSPSPFRSCFSGCLLPCAIQKKFPNALMCPFTCIMTCIPRLLPIPSPPSTEMILANKINEVDYFCKLGCATRHCAPLSTLQNPNVEKVVECVDSCSDKCSTKN